MLLVKIKNAVELGWDSFDSREKALVAYAAAWLLFMLLLSLQRKSRERLKAELVEELRGGSPA